MVTVSVLGGNGFIGSHLVDSLIRQNFDVTVVDHFSTSAPRFVETPKELVKVELFEYGSVAESIPLGSIVVDASGSFVPGLSGQSESSGVEKEFVTHFSSLVSHVSSREISAYYFCSSGGAVYGVGAGLPFKETDLPRPVSAYGRMKWNCENVLADAASRYGFFSSSWRFSNLYGPRQKLSKEQGLIARAIDAAEKGFPLPLTGQGTTVRDYLHVKDACAIAADLIARGPENPRVINVGSGRGFSTIDVIRLVEDVFGKTVLTEPMDAPSWHPNWNVLDVSLMLKLVRNPQIRPLKEGIEEILALRKRSI